MNEWSLDNGTRQDSARTTKSALSISLRRRLSWHRFNSSRKAESTTFPHVMDQDMPVPGFHGSYFANTQYTLENGVEWHDRVIGKMNNGYSAQNLRMAISDHSGTHIDQLNHVGQMQENGEFLVYNGIRNRDIIDTFGTRRLGAEFMPPVVARGVLIDVATRKGVEYLPAGYAIQPGELDETLEAQGTEVRKGDVVLVPQAGAAIGATPKKRFPANRGSERRARSGRLTKTSFAGAWTSLRRIDSVRVSGRSFADAYRDAYEGGNSADGECQDDRHRRGQGVRIPYDRRASQNSRRHRIARSLAGHRLRKAARDFAMQATGAVGEPAMAASKPHIQLRGVSKILRTERGAEITALSGIDLDIENGSFVAVVGPSGCGKTTLLNQIAGLADPTDGEISVRGMPVRGPGRDRGMVFRRTLCSFGERFAETSNMGWKPRVCPAPKGEIERKGI